MSQIFYGKHFYMLYLHYEQEMGEKRRQPLDI